MIEWHLFKDSYPEQDRLIVYGSHRWLDVIIYEASHPKIKEYIQSGSATHWAYIEPPKPLAF